MQRVDIDSRLGYALHLNTGHRLRPREGEEDDMRPRNEFTPPTLDNNVPPHGAHGGSGGALGPNKKLDDVWARGFLWLCHEANQNTKPTRSEHNES